MQVEKKWKKNLYEKHDLPDNYTSETFLKELQRNVHFKPLTFSKALYGASLVQQELCTVILFVLTYVHLYNKWMEPYLILYTTTVFTLFGFLMYRGNLNNVFNEAGQDLRTVLIYIVFGQLFSPVLHTLTDTISTDTIYTMTFFMMLIHLIFFDYNVPAAIVSNSLSLSAAVFASICLSSRLSSAYEAFILITVSIQLFVLFPLSRNRIKQYVPTTSILILIVLYTLVQLSYLVTSLFVITTTFLTIVCPYLFTKYQKYKDNIYGPWDEAVIPDVKD